MTYLLLVTYPAFNKGAPCSIVIATGPFEEIVDLAENNNPETVAAEHAADLAPFVAPPGWDYLSG